MLIVIVGIDLPKNVLLAQVVPGAQQQRQNRRHRAARLGSEAGIFFAPDLSEFLSKSFTTLFEAESRPGFPCFAIISLVRNSAHVLQHSRHVHAIPHHDHGVPLGEFIVKTDASAPSKISLQEGPEPASVSLGQRWGVQDNVQAQPSVQPNRFLS